MKTIRIRRKISSSILKISELKDFIGKYVEILVFERKKNQTGLITSGKNIAAGILSKYKDSGKIEEEKIAWSKATIEKHGNFDANILIKKLI